MLPNQPILISDEEIKEGEPGYSINNATYTHFSHLGSSYGRKIIAGVKDLPSVDFSALSEEDCKKIGWIDVEKLAWKKLQYFNGNQWEEQLVFEKWTEGFKTAQSLNEKKFSEEDIRKAILFGYKKGMKSEADAHRDNNLFEEMDFNVDNFVQSLSQPKVFNVEIQIDRVRYPKGDDGWEDVYTPRITNNTIKITNIL